MKILVLAKSELGRGRRGEEGLIPTAEAEPASAAAIGGGGVSLWCDAKRTADGPDLLGLEAEGSDNGDCERERCRKKALSLRRPTADLPVSHSHRVCIAK